MQFVYTNHRNETRERTIIPWVLAWEDNESIREYGYDPGLFITGMDTKRNVQRSFSVKRMVPLGSTNIIHDFRDYIPRSAVTVLVEACKRVIEEGKKTPNKRDMLKELIALEEFVRLFE